LQVDVYVTAAARFSGTVSVSLPQLAKVQQIPWNFHAGDNRVRVSLVVSGGFQLWWPAGYGGQPLYTLSAVLSNASAGILDSSTQQIAFRKAELVTEPLPGQNGTSM
jgi:hypothetical protein